MLNMIAKAIFSLLLDCFAFLGVFLQSELKEEAGRPELTHPLVGKVKMTVVLRENSNFH